MPVRRLHIFALIVLVAHAGGCSTPTALATWQASLERYVVEQGHGDVNVLRRSDRPPSESDFGLIGAATGGFPFISPRRTDANGVLLGHRLIDDRGWFVYLVGMVEYRGSFVNWPLDKPRVKEIRLVAVSARETEFTWMTDEPNAVVVDRYCLPQLERWQRSDPSRAESTDAPVVFPTEGDAFVMTVADTAVAVLDRHSGAEWTLDIRKRSDADDP